MMSMMTMSKQMNDDNEEDNDDKEEQDPVIVLENVIALTLLPEGEVPVADVAELDIEIEEVLDDEEEEEYTTKHTFFDLDQDSMIILSFPDLKIKI